MRPKMSTSHCRECGSEVCNHGNCPECRPCQHCYGGDRQNKYFPEDDEREESIRADVFREDETDLQYFERRCRELGIKK